MTPAKQEDEPSMNRESYPARADVGASTVDFKMSGAGNAVLVMLKGNSTPTVTVDFQCSIDGANWFAAPYAGDNFVDLTPTRISTQISDPTTATLYLVLPPISQFRISLGAISVGTLDVVIREVMMGGGVAFAAPV